MAQATAVWKEDEWEFVNDDGFVYKRQRCCPDPTTTASAPPAPDPAAEEKNRKERKKRALINLRDKYREEISQWELLSNKLKALQEKARKQQQVHQQEPASSSDMAEGLPHSHVRMPEHAGQRLLDELLLRAESEEAIVEDVSNLCDVAEAICSVQEEHKKQSLVNLLIWASPQELMAFLSDE